MTGRRRSTSRLQRVAVDRSRELHNRDVEREEDSASRCRYCGRGPGLGVFLSPGLDPQWDGDGDVCTVCFDLRADGWSWNGEAWIEVDDHGAGCDGPLNCTCVAGEVDTWSSVSRQHFIDTGEYLTVAEAREGTL